MHFGQLSIQKIQSAFLVNSLIIDEINKSNLFESNKNDYILVYNKQLMAACLISLRNRTKEAKLLAAECIIYMYSKCKDKVVLGEQFKYKHLLGYIKNGNKDKLAKKLFECKTKLDIEYKPMSFTEKLFSIQKGTKRKIITILGLKIKLKLKNKQLKAPIV